MEFIAHRGASFAAPENSLQAMELAIGEGADRLEFDVRTTRDGEVVVCHDATTGRCGDRDIVVAESTLAELRAVRLANGEPIPTLNDVCALAHDRVPLDVEFKSEGSAVVERTLDVLAAHDMLADALLTSFSEATVRAARRLGHGGPLGLIVGSKSWKPTQRLFEAWPIRAMRRAGADALVIHHRLAHAPLRRALAAAGHSLYLWMSIEDEAVAPDARAAAYLRLPVLAPRGVIIGRVAEARAVVGRPTDER